METDEGKQIYIKKKNQFQEKGKNTNYWQEKIRGEHLRKIVHHFQGGKIPYSCFTSSKNLCKKLFGSENDWNYIYYTIFMGLNLGKLVEETDGLICKDEIFSEKENVDQKSKNRHKYIIGYVPSKSDCEKVLEKLSISKDGIDEKEVLNLLKSFFKERNISLQDNWRETTKKNCRIWFGQENVTNENKS